LTAAPASAADRWARLAAGFWLLLMVGALAVGALGSDEANQATVSARPAAMSWVGDVAERRGDLVDRRLRVRDVAGARRLEQPARRRRSRAGSLRQVVADQREQLAQSVRPLQPTL
jgi:hypothetical protein